MINFNKFQQEVLGMNTDTKSASNNNSVKTSAFKSNHEHQEDFRLIRSFVNGNESAFEELYQRHHQRIFCISFRMLKNISDAEDMAQDVFIVLHKKLKTFRGESAFTSWLHRLTVNQVLMHFRKIKRGSQNIVELEDAAITFADQKSFKEYDFRRNSVIDKLSMEEAIEQLPAGYREMYLLHEVNGYEHQEIAIITAKSAGTSKSQLSKARITLKRILTRKVNPKITKPHEPVYTPCY